MPTFSHPELAEGVNVAHICAEARAYMPNLYVVLGASVLGIPSQCDEAKGFVQNLLK